MTSYRLQYFDARARGELSRLLFHMADVKYEDDRFTFAEWPAIKPTTPLGQVPVLHVDGKALSQSLTIARYLAEDFGLAGKSAWDKARADMVVESTIDMINPVIPSLIFEPDANKKVKLRKAYEQEELPKHLSNFERILNENEGDYFVGEEMTWADLAVMHHIQWLENTMLGVRVPRDKYPKLDALLEKLESHPKLKSYFLKRPPSGV